MSGLQSIICVGAGGLATSILPVPRPGYGGLTQGHGAVVGGNQKGAKDLQPVLFQEPDGLGQKDLVLEYPAAQHHGPDSGPFGGFMGAGQEKIDERAVEAGADLGGGSFGSQGRGHPPDYRGQGNNEFFKAFLFNKIR